MIGYPTWHLKFKQLKVKGKDRSGLKGYSGVKGNQSNRKVVATAEGVAVDYVSKCDEAQALPTNDARVVITFLKKLFFHFDDDYGGVEMVADGVKMAEDGGAWCGEGAGGEMMLLRRRRLVAAMMMMKVV
ncbi:hypothetical protein Tco_0145264 [Tanacetum coccineum]